MKRSLPTLFVALALLLSACGGTATEAAPPDEPAAPTDAPPPEASATTEPTSAAPPDAQPVDGSPWQSEFDPLPAEPVAVSIPTADGRALSGMYYPAKVNPAPIVVMMHWAGGDQYDWWELAPWLQNRADEYAPGAWPGTGVNGPWLNPSWFPLVLPEASFGVLVFDFGGYGSSPRGSSPDSDLQDVLAAVRFAATLDGVDPARVLALGGSLGADGALDACVLFNRDPSEGAACIGSLSLSPGNYLGAPFSYTEGALELGDAGHSVYCLAAENDRESGHVCAEPEHENYYGYIYSGDDHAMFLIQPYKMPSTPPQSSETLKLVLEWLALATGLPTQP
ncbi:MAG: hypothetical protein EPO32_05375 [Anaerolineae bacterium]|nr:MAG: hypothetical protein EPO32_05375 [Anaerolineae bacterium]